MREQMDAVSALLGGLVIDEMHRLSAAIRGAISPDLSPTREVTRLLTYRGPASEVAAQLARSLPDGPCKVRQDAVTITARTLHDSSGLLLGEADPVSELLVRIVDLEDELSAARLAARDERARAAALQQERNEVGLLDRVRQLVSGPFSVEALRDLLGPR